MDTQLVLGVREIPIGSIPAGEISQEFKVWDYQTKTCVQTLEGHTHHVSAVCFHPELPIIITSYEDDRVFARKLAEDNNVPLSSINGTGPDGSIVKADIEEYLVSHAAA